MSDRALMGCGCPRWGEPVCWPCRKVVFWLRLRRRDVRGAVAALVR